MLNNKLLLFYNQPDDEYDISGSIIVLDTFDDFVNFVLYINRNDSFNVYLKRNLSNTTYISRSQTMQVYK